MHTAASVNPSLHAFEQTCIDFEAPSTRVRAEQALLEFRGQKNPIPACRHVLEASQLPQARFQAVLAMRDAAVRSWSLMDHAAQIELRSYLLHYILRHADQPSLVLRPLTGTLAAVVKRGWKDARPVEREHFFSELEQAVHNARAQPARRAALEILSSIVLEFSPATASPLGQSWEFHEECRGSLEASFLPTLFVHAAETGQASVAAALAGHDSGVCLAAIRLLTAILQWEFRHPSAPPVVYGAGRPSTDSLLVRPGKAWRSLLLAPEAVEWLSELLTGLRGQSTPLAETARNLLVTMCSVSGDIFPRPAAADRRGLGLTAADDAAVLFLRRLLIPVTQWITPAQQVLQQAATVDQGELLDACRAIAAAAAVHRAAGFEAAMPSDGANSSQSGGALGTVCTITEACVAARGIGGDAHADWLEQSTELLLDAWVDLVVPDSGSPQETSPAREAAASAAGRIFEALVTTELRECAAEAFEDEAEGEAAAAGGGGDDASELEQSFARTAALGRAAPGNAMLAIAGAIHDRLQRLQQCLAEASDTSTVLEELCWLCRIGAHVAADSGRGETPLPPVAVAAAAASAAAHGRPDALEALSHSLLAVTGLCLDEQMHAAASPRLMEAAVWAAARWADTYLLPIKAVSPAMGAAFGSNGNGQAVLRVLALVALRLLGSTAWAGEVDLHRVAVQKLLAALVRRRTVCESLAELDEWRQLAGAFAAQGEAIQQLAAPLQRALAQILCQASVGLPGDGAVGSYIGHLLQKALEDIKELSRRSDLSSLAERPDVSHRAEGLISILRGAAAGCGPRSQPSLWAAIRPVLGPLLTLSRAFRSDPSTTCLLLKLASELVDAHISFLVVADAQTLCDWVLQLLRQYSAHGRGRTSLAASKRLRDEAAAETYRDLRALLRLLTQLTNRDVADFAPDAGRTDGAAVDVAQVVFLGLEILVPLMRDEQLKFPKLARAYFTLLSYMLEVYPDRVAGCPSAQVDQIVATLRWGLLAVDLDVVQPALEALAALARYQTAALAAGHQTDPNILGLHARLGGFLEAVFERLLMGEDWRDTVDAAADSLLPLILSHQPAFQQLGERLVSGRPEGEPRERVSAALSQLLGSNGLTADLERPNRRRFRTNLVRFVGSVRELVRTQ